MLGSFQPEGEFGHLYGLGGEIHAVEVGVEDGFVKVEDATLADEVGGAFATFMSSQIECGQGLVDSLVLLHQEVEGGDQESPCTAGRVNDASFQ